MNLMIGTAPTGKGGIASVVQGLIDADFLKHHGVRYISSHCEGSRSRKLWITIRAFASLIKECVLDRPRIVHVHSASRGSFYRKSLLLAVARAFGCKTIFHLHGAEFRQFACDESSPAMQWWIRRTLTKSSKVIALSDSWAAFMASFAPGTHTLVVANSVEVPVLSVGQLSDPYRVLFLGRVGKRKGVFELLNAIALLADYYPQLKLIVGGDGDLAPLRDAVEDLKIGPFVDVLGWIGPQQKALEISRADIFALPSYDEGLPMAMLEAMAAAKAIVVTPVGGIPDAVADGVSGLLVPVGDEQALASALRTLLDDPRLCKTLGANARLTIESRFSTAVAISKLDQVYAELSGAHVS